MGDRVVDWVVFLVVVLEDLVEEVIFDLVESLEVEFEWEFIVCQVEVGQERVLVMGFKISELDDQSFVEGLIELE